MSTHPHSSRVTRSPRARLAGLAAIGASLLLSGCVVPGAVVYDDPYPVYPSAVYPSAVYPSTVYVEPAPIWVDPFYVPSYRPRVIQTDPYYGNPRAYPRQRPPQAGNPPAYRPPRGQQPAPGYRPPRGQQPPPGHVRPDRRPPPNYQAPGYRAPDYRAPEYRQSAPSQHRGVRPVPQPLRAPRDTGENSGP